jgi:integrase
MIRLLMLTGQRREEVAALNWEELDREAAEWVLPAERSKNGKAHTVPLSPAALAVLDELPNAWQKNGLVFTTTGRTPASGHSRAKERLDRLVSALPGGDDVKPWRVHDLRRTVATGLQRLGVRFEVTEAVLNHVSGSRSGVAGVYQRHNWRDEKREALNSWATHLATVTK